MSVALCPFSIRGVGNTDIVYVRVVKMRSVATHVAWSVCLSRPWAIGVNSYWAQGLKPLTFMIMGLAYMTSSPTLWRDIVYIVFQLFALVLRNADKSTVRAFIPCSARHFWKRAKFASSVGHPVIKMLSASGGFAPLTFCPGALPLDPTVVVSYILLNGGRSGLTHFHFWTLAGLH